MDEKDEGFTLIELLVVIIIIGILAAIAIPVFLNQRKKGYDSQAKSDLRNFATAEETYFTDNNAYGTIALMTATTGAGAGNQTVKLSKNTTVTVKFESANKLQWCATSTNTGGSATYVYDSANGGLQPNSTTACPGSYGTVGDSLTG